MPKSVMSNGCRGNYSGEPYTKVVEFPTDEVERNRWIDAVPNEHSSLRQLKKIYPCAHHFDCEWITVKGRKRPSQPPSIFHVVPQSYMLQADLLTIQKYN